MLLWLYLFLYFKSIIFFVSFNDSVIYVNENLAFVLWPQIVFLDKKESV